ncbi:MAG: hypothetical protein MJ252_06070 [archaeon]|nr:hypothetical protein [archaeon]
MGSCNCNNEIKEKKNANTILETIPEEDESNKSIEAKDVPKIETTEPELLKEKYFIPYFPDSSFKHSVNAPNNIKNGFESL